MTRTAPHRMHLAIDSHHAACGRRLLALARTTTDAAEITCTRCQTRHLTALYHAGLAASSDVSDAWDRRADDETIRHLTSTLDTARRAYVEFRALVPAIADRRGYAQL